MVTGRFPFPKVELIKDPTTLPPTRAERTTRVSMTDTLDTAFEMAKRYAAMHTPPNRDWREERGLNWD